MITSFRPASADQSRGAPRLSAVYWYPHGATRAVQKLSDHTSYVLAAATDASGTVLVTGGTDHRVVVHRLEHGRWVTREVLSGHQGDILELAVTPDGRRAFSTGEDRTVIEWDLTDSMRFGAVLPQVSDPDHTDFPLITGEPISVANTSTWVVPMVTQPLKDPVRAQMVAAFLEGSDLTKPKIVGWVPIGTGPLDAVPFGAAAVTRDGERAAVAEESSTAILDVRDHHVLADITFDVARRRALGLGSTDWGPVSDAWSADGSRLFIGMGDPDQGEPGTSGAVVVVDAATWQPQRRILDSGAGVNAMQLSPDGRLLAVGYASGDVALADAATYRVIHRLHVQGNVRSIAFSPDGTRLAAAFEKRFQVWDVQTGNALFAQPPYFAGGAVSLAWLPDGHTIVYGGDDGHAVLFDTAAGVTRGVPLPVFRDGGGGFVFAAPIAGDRLALFPGARPGLVTREGVVYSLNPADWLAHACAVADRDLTTAEWTAYIPERHYRKSCSELS